MRLPGVRLRGFLQLPLPAQYELMSTKRVGGKGGIELHVPNAERRTNYRAACER
jgi:hypothetical protein